MWSKNVWSLSQALTLSKLPHQFFLLLRQWPENLKKKTQKILLPSKQWLIVEISPVFKLQISKKTKLSNKAGWQIAIFILSLRDDFRLILKLCHLNALSTASSLGWMGLVELRPDLLSSDFAKSWVGRLFEELRLVLEGAIYLPDSFEFTIYRCMRLSAFRHEWASLNRIAADKSHGVIVA